jgi:hypothetical protein
LPEPNHESVFRNSAQTRTHYRCDERIGVRNGEGLGVGRCARNVDAYKSHLAACDQPRHSDLDGRGNLSEENLAAFTQFFLTTCIDQVTFMERLMQPEQLRARILIWAEKEVRLNHLPPKSGAILEAVLYHGVLTSESTRAHLRLAFPATLASRWMPGLFPERAS